MDFRLTEDQETLVAGVRDFLAGAHGPEMLRVLDASQTRRSPDLWRELCDMGLPGLLIPEEHGGLGLGLVEGAMIALELGRSAVAEPIVDTALVAVPWLVRRGQTDLLPALATGGATVALAHPVNPWVADLDRATWIVGGGKVERSTNSAPISAESVDPLRRLFAPPDSVADDELLLDLAALMSAAQLIGLADGMLAQAVDYAKARQQFGQPIGAFQAVKHHLASVAVRIEFAKPVLMRAAAGFDQDEALASVHVSHAKLAASEAALLAAETAIQVHGAMGYTYEVDLHFWMKRSWALAGAWGDRAFHLRRIDDAVLAGTMPVGAAATFA
jgi:alkylation response protein AidB-like acyl-CoA dehydrogenase